MPAWLDDIKSLSLSIRGLADMPNERVISPNYPAATAVGVYRNNYRGNLQGALAAAYPVMVQIVGDAFFQLLARRFIERHPSRSGNLHLYGEELGDYVDGFEPAQGLPYLADIARLEWACHRAYFAPDADALDVARLAQVAAEQYAFLRLLIHPACRVLRSAYPIAAIWQAHQPGMPGEFRIDLNRGAENVLVSRYEDAVRVTLLNEAEAEWLQRIHAGVRLESATAATLARHPAFDLQAMLASLIALGIITDIEV